MRLLVTGGAGYIGSHTVVQLLEAGHEVVVFDDLSNSSELAIERVAQITGKGADLVVGDITDEAAVERVFAANDFDAVVHFAGLKSVGESVEEPIRYYRTNVGGTLALIEAMVSHGVFDLVVQLLRDRLRHPDASRSDESAGTSPTNPYGATKLVVEDVLWDVATSDPRWSVALLRYFNPVGAHECGLIGEDPAGPEQPHAVHLPGSRCDASRSSGSSATTTTHPTAPACGTTSMSSTSPPVTSAPWRGSARSERSTPGTSAPAMARASSRWLPRSRRRPAPEIPYEIAHRARRRCGGRLGRSLQGRT